MQYILLVGDTIILFNQYHQLGQNFPMSLSYWIYINKTNKTTGVSEKRKNEKPKRNIFIRSKLVFSIVCYGRYCISCCKCFCILLVAQNLHWTESWKYFPEKKLFEVEIALLALKEKYQQGKKKPRTYKGVLRRNSLHSMFDLSKLYHRKMWPRQSHVVNNSKIVWIESNWTE